MKFRTTVDIGGDLPVILHSDAIEMLGSCFTENIGARLHSAMLDVDVNPFGTLYNPASIAAGLRRLTTGMSYTEDELFSFGGLWHSADHHSRFSSVDRDNALTRINERFERAAERLRTARHLIVTFGTAYTFTDRISGRVVANCHKQPAGRFERRCLTVGEIADIWCDVIEDLRRINAEIDVTITVSPVRHLADGAHGNQLSKATLLLAVDEIIAKSEKTYYFPAYEIVLDELRDYRFFAADMTHPSEVAADYVAERFVETCLTAEAQTAAADCRRLSQRLQHRPLTDDAEAMERFRLATAELAATLTARYPYLEKTLRTNFDNEIFNR